MPCNCERLTCSLCLYMHKPPTDKQRKDNDYETLTIINGELVCAYHAGYLYLGKTHTNAMIDLLGLRKTD